MVMEALDGFDGGAPRPLLLGVSGERQVDLASNGISTIRLRLNGDPLVDLAGMETSTLLLVVNGDRLINRESSEN